MLVVNPSAIPRSGACAGTRRLLSPLRHHAADLLAQGWPRCQGLCNLIATWRLKVASELASAPRRARPLLCVQELHRSQPQPHNCSDANHGLSPASSQQRGWRVAHVPGSSQLGCLGCGDPSIPKTKAPLGFPAPPSAALWMAHVSPWASRGNSAHGIREGLLGGMDTLNITRLPPQTSPKCPTSPQPCPDAGQELHSAVTQP